jgi:2-(1,2-epoxy-1,2-dihydrophenyl)acetyl-CoA isomerase
MSAEQPSVLVSRDAGVVTVTLNRPHKKNAIDGVTWGLLQQTFDEVERSRDDRVLVITGAGGDFCSGADLTSLSDDDHGLRRMRRIGDVALTLHRLTKPTIARIDGVAAGAGMNLALGCDLIVASDRSRFAEIFAKRGLSVDFGGSWLLPMLIGLHRAKELCLLADIISAQQAADMGLVNRVVPVDQLDEVVGDWASRLASGPPIALMSTKRLLNNAFEVTMEQALDDEARTQTANFGTEDTVEAFAAFAAKREPTFTGKPITAR